MSILPDSFRIPALMLAIPLVFGSMFAGCSSSTITNAVKPFRIDVRQGNYVSQKMISQLSPGQTMEQVRFIMGTPLLVDVFHANRWDYVYQLSTGQGELQRRRIALFFVDGKLSRLDGDVVAAAGDTPKADAPVAPRVIEIEAPASKR